jgi:outer membrane receptor protein involved in Fe transport
MISNIQMIINRVLAFGALLPVAAAGLVFSTSASAQDEDSIFEEIVVTAQKRRQNIMEVPLAVSAVTGRQMEEASIKDIFDLQQNVPGLIAGQSQTATTSNFAIRGIGSTSNNFGVESAVGLYVDGVYRSRQSSIINDLVDIERVEVLRGPQGTLFGKNTPAGAISISSVRPGQELDAFVDVTFGDLSLVKLSAGANIPINDDLAFRGTVFSSQRDGYGDDLVFGDDVYNDKDRFGTRLQLFYEPSDDLNIRIIADYSEIDETCCFTTSFVDGLVKRSTLNFPDDAGSDTAFLQFGGTIFTDYPYPPPLIDGIRLGIPQGTLITGVSPEDNLTAYSFLPISQNEDSGLSVEINKTFDSGMTFTSISAYRSFETFDHIDADFADVDLLTRDNSAEQSSFSQEFRLAGEFGSGSHYVFGAYYFAQEIDQVTDTFGTPFLEIYLNGTPDVVDATTLINTVFGISQAVYAGLPGGPFPSPYLPAALAFTPGSGNSQDNILQDQDGYAVFGQIDFAINDDFTLTLGARYTDETKDIDARFTQGVPLGGPIPDFGGLALWGCILTACHPDAPAFNPADLLLPSTLATFNSFSVGGWGTYLFPPIQPRPDLADSLADDQVTGTAKLSWFVNDTSMVYLSYATGFKSGGTNTERISPAFDSIFQAETSESFEIGFKGDIGPVRLAVTVYDTTFDDFQASTFTGTGFNLQNAGTIENQGVELEMLYRPTDSTDIQLIYAHNEVDITSFENGTCYGVYEFHTGIVDPGTLVPENLQQALGSQICDKSGTPAADNPEDRLFLSIQQEINLSSNTNMIARIEYSHFSEQFTDSTLDPFGVQDDFQIVNASIAFNIDSWNSTFKLWARNLTDERYNHGTFDAPFQSGRMNAYPSEPSTFGVSFRKNFD